MARPALLQPQDLIAQLPPGQPLPAAVLTERLGVNRMTLSRLVAASGGQVVRLGQTRATAYSLRQPSRAGSEWPLYRLREDATLEEVGRMTALSGDTFHVDASRARTNLQRAPRATCPVSSLVCPGTWTTCGRRDSWAAASPTAAAVRSACRLTSIDGSAMMC
jgi:hypothetical protein